MGALAARKKANHYVLVLNLWYCLQKDEALRSLIANDMNLQSAISDLYNNNGHYMPPGDRPFNHMVPPMQNTPFNNNAQLTKNVPVGARTGAVKHNSSQPHPMGEYMLVNSGHYLT